MMSLLGNVETAKELNGSMEVLDRLQGKATRGLQLDSTLTKAGYAADAKATGDAVRSFVSYPKTEDGTPNHGTEGQFAVSDGKGGIEWLTVGDGNEVAL
jgi:hypothetical protein